MWNKTVNNTDELKRVCHEEIGLVGETPLELINDYNGTPLARRLALEIDTEQKLWDYLGSLIEFEVDPTWY